MKRLILVGAGLVAAVALTGCSSAQEVSLRPVADLDPQVPAAPQHVSARAQGSDMVRVTWTAPAGTTAVSGYRVDVDDTQVVTVGTGTRQHTFIGLAAGEKHVVHVVAVNGTGTGPTRTATARLQGIPKPTVTPTSVPMPTAPSVPRPRVTTTVTRTATPTPTVTVTAARSDKAACDA